MFFCLCYFSNTRLCSQLVGSIFQFARLVPYEAIEQTQISGNVSYGIFCLEDHYPLVGDIFSEFTKQLILRRCDFIFSGRFCFDGLMLKQ